MNREKVLEDIRNNPRNVGFDDLCWCARKYEFVHVRTNGSHRIYRHPSGRMLDLQPREDGKAKHYQVMQFLKAIDDLYQEQDQ